MRKVFRKLSEFQDVLNLLMSYEGPNDVEEVPLEEAAGRIVAEDVVSDIDVPGFDRAAVDGYAIRAEDTFWVDEDKPVRLKVIGMAAAGHPFSGQLEDGEAVEIATGAPLPRGANAIVMEEYTERSGNEILVFRAVSPGDNIHEAGSDIRRGETVIYADTLLSARDIGVLSAIGKTRVKVRSLPKVGILSTGDELILPGEELKFGKIHDVNSFTVFSAVKEDGGIPKRLGILPDSYDEIKRSLEKALDEFDLVILSGSTSVGAGDVMYRILEELGPPGVLVHGIAIHPGKPTIIAEARGKLIVSLPGYPTSAMTIYQSLVSPLLRRWSGKDREEAKTIKAVAAERIFGEKGRRDLLPVHVIREGNALLTFPVPTGSEAITTLSRADGYIVMEENQEIVEEGEEIVVHLYRGSRIADVSVIGSHCLGLERILARMRKRYVVKAVFVGSTGGFKAVSRREADVAGVHALDPESWTYNIPFMGRYGLKGKAVIVRGYKREQGLILPRGNPKGIRSIGDLIGRDDIIFINRNKGSGTRILFDALLEKEAKSVGLSFEEAVSKVRGYWSEAKSHSAVAAAVYHGIADVGVGIRTAAALYNLEFIKLAEENYDFLIKKKSLDREPVVYLLELLRDPELRKELNSLEGIEAGDDMGEVLWS